MPEKNAKTVSLVLGSGGARGLAHIGVIEWLCANGYQIRSISGSSMGALVGGVFAAGKLEIYKNWVLALDKADVIRFLDFSFSSDGLFKGDRIIAALKELVGEHAIESLPIRYTAVAADVDRQKEIWLDEGPLFDAIRASIAVPTVFTPHEYRGMRLLDGGLLNPVPIMPTLKDMNDLTIAVNVNATTPDLHPAAPATTAPAHEHKNRNSYHQRILDFIDSIQRAGKRSQRSSWNMLELVNSSFETMQHALSCFKIAASPPDVLIEIPRDACRAFEFYKAAALIELGWQRAEAAMATKD